MPLPPSNAIPSRVHGRPAGIVASGSGVVKNDRTFSRLIGTRSGAGCFGSSFPFGVGGSLYAFAIQYPSKTFGRTVIRCNALTQ